VGREILVVGLVLLDRADDPPMRGEEVVLACAPAPSLAHISDHLKHILE